MNSKRIYRLNVRFDCIWTLFYKRFVRLIAVFAQFIVILFTEFCYQRNHPINITAQSMTSRAPAKYSNHHKMC